jgi:hypothetical protein
MYDLEKKQFIGGSSAGKIFTGLGTVVLRTGSVSVLDFNGNDLLGGAAPSVSVPDETTKAMADIAAAFGCGSKS